MAQAPPTHMLRPLAGVGHASPQPPQCLAEDITSTQEPPQFSRPPEQASLHAPWSQTLPASHATLQPPQCSGSASRSRQTPEQSVNGVSHTMPQVLSTQVGAPLSGIRQPSPQPPQLSTSPVVSRHTSPQGVKPSTQVKRQTPLTQTASALSGAVHVAPQPPQWSSRSSSTTHSPPQVVSPSLQVTGVITVPLGTHRLVAGSHE